MPENDSFNPKILLDRIRELEDVNKRLTEEIDRLKSNSSEIVKSERFKEKYANKILESIPDMLTVLTPSGKFVDLVSSEESNHIGEPSCKLIGRHISSMLPAKAYINVKHNLDRVKTTNTGSISHHTLTVGGNEHHYENRIFPLDKDYLLCICRDITENTKAQQKIQRHNRN